jgi:hypothetical protein
MRRGIQVRCARTTALALVAALAVLVQPAPANAARPGWAGRDNRPPSTPAGLATTGRTATSVNLSWGASTDNVGVVAYDVYLRGSLVRSVTGTAATVADLVPGRTYTFSVRARDAAGNASRPSNRVAATAGRYRSSDLTVFGFSQSDVDQEDPQVYQLAPDINIRAIGKWSTSGDEAADYNFGQLARYHEKGVVFVGSGTASVIFPPDFATPAVFDDMSTRDADNAPVPHEEVAVDARRGNMFNPAYRRYLLGWAKIQIDGGVDGLNFDEVLSGFSGGRKYGFNGNEGFDDYALAGFNRYLLAKYPAFTAADWKSRFGMTDDNIVRSDVPANDLDRNFNYRRYLRAHGWNTNPLIGANPLRPEWGDAVDNRMYADDMSFVVSSLRRFWKDMVDELRAYAASTAHRQLLITSNGLLPFVDFNSVGMYPFNPDEQTPDFRGADYVPVVDGHLNGAKSLQANYRYLKNKSNEIAGAVPVVVFIDWPTDMMTNYLNLPLSEKLDYWRIFGAEAYANGIFPAFHLKDTIGEPTAEQSGTLSFFQTYSQFYRDHRVLYRDTTYATEAVRVGAANVAASLLSARGGGSARALHLVNHNYAQAIVPQTGFRVEVDLASCPRRVTMVSPDFAGSKLPASTCQGGRLAVTVDRLDAYDVLVFE